MTHPRLRSAPVRLLATVTLAPLVLGSIVASGLGAAAVAPTGSPTVLSATTATGVVATLRVYAQTQKYFYQDGVVDPSRDTLYLADASDSTTSGMVRVNLATGVATATELAGGYAASDVAVSPLDGTVYVSHNTGPGNSSISVLDPDATYSATAPVPQIPLATDHAQRLEIAADGRVYVTHLSERAVTVIGATNGPDRMHVVQTITGIDTGFTAMDTAGNRLYIASKSARTVSVIDVSMPSATLLGVFPVDSPPIGMTWDATRNQLVVTFAPNTVEWITPSLDGTSSQTTRREFVAPIPEGSDWPEEAPVAVRADGTALVLTEVWPTETNSYVSVIPPVVTTATPVTAVQVGSDGFALVMDQREGGTAYVTNVGAGTVSVITGTTLTTFSTTHTVGTAGRATAAVTRADKRPFTGSVSFTRAGQSPVSAAVGADGFAAASIDALSPGTASFDVAVTAPAGIALTGTSDVVTELNASTTTMTLDSTSIDVGAPITAHVAVALDSGTATGEVSVTDALGRVFGAAELVDGTAAVALSGLPVGATSLTAHFAGDAHTVASISDATVVAVAARALEVTSATGSGVVGSTFTVTLAGFAPNEDVEVTMHSTPVLLGTVTVDATGAGTLVGTVPNVEIGAHSVVAVGSDSGSTVGFAFEVLAASSTLPTGLASTGFDSTLPLGVAALLLVAGLLAIALTAVRRRRAARV